MAKSQKRSNREVRKPKTAKPKVADDLSPASKFPVSAIMEKSRRKT